jgi:hypothetical protein
MLHLAYCVANMPPADASEQALTGSWKAVLGHGATCSTSTELLYRLVLAQLIDACHHALQQDSRCENKVPQTCAGLTGNHRCDGYMLLGFTMLRALVAVFRHVRLRIGCQRLHRPTSARQRVYGS